MFLRNSYFSNADIHMLHMLANVSLLINRMFTSEWKVYHKLFILQETGNET